METECVNSTVTPQSSSEKDWQARYAEYLKGSLDWAKTYVQQNAPSEIRQHIRSFLGFLRQAHHYPSLNLAAAELISTIHPWPQRWGHWDAWEMELRFAIAVFSEQHRTIQQAQFLSHLADLIFKKGKFDQALTLAQEAYHLARADHDPEGVVQASIVIHDTLRAFSATDQMAVHHAEVVALLDQMRTAPLSREWQIANARLKIEDLSYLREQGKLVEAIGIATEVISMLESIIDPDRILLATAYRERALFFWSHSDYHPAVEDLLYAIRLFANEDDQYAEVYASSILGLVYWSMSKFSLAAEILQRNIIVEEKLNASWLLIRNMGDLGLVQLSQGKIDSALEYLERHLDLATQLEDIREIQRARINRATAWSYQGRHQDAAQELESGIEYYCQHGAALEGLSCDRLHLSYCYVHLGWFEKARQTIEEVFEAAHQIGSPALKAMALYYWTFLLPKEKHIEPLKEALDLARPCQRRLDEAACLLKLSNLTPSTEEAEQLWQEGVKILNEIGATEWMKNASPSNPPDIILML